MQNWDRSPSEAAMVIEWPLNECCWVDKRGKVGIFDTSFAFFFPSIKYAYDKTKFREGGSAPVPNEGRRYNAGSRHN